jgi:hypothetical protein
MTNILELYHGTTHDFKEIDVSRGKPFKDFGQGFYLTESFDRARNIALRNRKIEEGRLRKIGNTTQLPVFVYAYELDLLVMNKLYVKRFDTADREWLKFVIANRMNRACQHKYDIVIGPTANDDTRTSIRTAINAANGAILSDSALDFLIEILEPNNLPAQYYFGTDKATALLNPTERYELR